MLDAVKLLSKISSGDVTTNVNVTTIPSTLVLTGNNLFPSMLAALRQANNYLRELKENIHTTCMKTIMSYMILHLTLEHAVVPSLQEEEPEQSSRSIQGIKYRRFAEILKENYPESKVDGTKLRMNSSYGRSFGEYGQSLGIASLLLFAVSDIGLRRIGKTSQTGIPALAASLTTSGT